MKIIETSIRRRVTIAMFTIGILLFGFVSFSRLKINLLPDLSYPTLTIRTEYTGAAPVEIENLISKPIEEALGIVKNVLQVWMSGKNWMLLFCRLKLQSRLSFVLIPPWILSCVSRLIVKHPE